MIRSHRFFLDRMCPSGGNWCLVLSAGYFSGLQWHLMALELALEIGLVLILGRPFPGVLEILVQ